MTMTSQAISLRDELDLMNSAEVLCMLTRAIRINPFIIVDPSELTFMDCAGLTSLIAARKLARDQGGELTLVNPQRIVARLLDLTGWSEQASPSTFRSGR